MPEDKTLWMDCRRCEAYVKVPESREPKLCAACFYYTNIYVHALASRQYPKDFRGSRRVLIPPSKK